MIVNVECMFFKDNDCLLQMFMISLNGFSVLVCSLYCVNGANVSLMSFFCFFLVLLFYFYVLKF